MSSLSEIIEDIKLHGLLKVIKAGTKRFIFRYDKEILISCSLKNPIPEIKPLFDITIRRATPADVEELRPYWWRRSSQLSEWITKDYPFFLAIAKDKIIGYTCISFELPENDPIFIEAINRAIDLKDDDAWVTGAFVLPAYRGGNIYPALAIEGLKYTKAAGYHRVLGTLLPENLSSRSANKKIGYKEIKEITFLRIMSFKRTMIKPLNHNNPFGADYWDRVASGMNGPLFHDQIAHYKRKELLDLISGWSPPGVARSILKTDLFEEAFGKDSLLDGLGKTCIGIDVSKIVVKEARQRLPGYPLLVADVCCLPFKKENFNLVISNSTLDHLPPKAITKAIDEVWRVLAPGGRLILTMDNRHNLLSFLSHSHWVRRWMGRFGEKSCFTIQEACNILRKAKFLVEDVTAIYHIPYPVNLLAKWFDKMIGSKADRLVQYIIAACHSLKRLPTRLLTGRFIALCAIKTYGFDEGYPIKQGL